MKIFITSPTAINGQSVKANPKKAVTVSDDIGRALISANKAVLVDTDSESGSLSKDDGVSGLEDLEAAFEVAMKEKDEAHAAEIKALSEQHEAAIAELKAAHAAEVSKSQKATK